MLLDGLYQGIQAVPVLLVAFVMALCGSLIVTPMVRRYAIAKGKYDLPGGRKIHTEPIPRFGGVGIAAGFFLPILLFNLFSPNLLVDKTHLAIVVGGALMFFVGLVDDMYDLSPYVKLLGQLLAVITTIGFGAQITALDLPFSQVLLLGSLAIPITVMWLVGVTNALNFIDGVDGLAGGVTLIGCVAFAVVSFFMKEPVSALLAILMAGAVLGFLVFNYHPAKIFMGDGGALLCGFVLAAISVVGVLKALTMFLLVPVFILTVPIVDITFATLRRVLQQKSPFVADSDHLHHKLLKAGFSQQRTVLVLYSVCVVGGMITTYYIHHLQEYLMVMAGLVLLSVLLIALRRHYSKYIPLEPVNNSTAEPAV